jgi:hypothetical protein
MLFFQNHLTPPPPPPPPGVCFLVGFLGVPRAADEARWAGCRATAAGAETEGAGAAWAGD